MKKQKNKALLISVGVAVSLFAMVIFAHSASASTYYMRADGTAANKATATSDASASTAMSVATHNAQTFAPDDIILLSDKGGTYKLVAGGLNGLGTSLVAPSSGTDGHSIIYANVPGETPVIDLSQDISAGGWTSIGNGIYQKTYGDWWRVLWEDGVPLHPASSVANVGVNGDWFYDGGVITYKPSSGTPGDHVVTALWFATEWRPFGIDIRNKSNIDIHGITFDHCGSAIGHAQDLSAPVSLIKNIKIHDNIINYTFWAIWGDLIGNGIEQDVEIYNNTINYCNSGISTWTASDGTPGHTQHPLRHNIHNNTINNLYSITDSLDWTYALLTSYYFTDHEGISFQDPMDCIVADNLITSKATPLDWSDTAVWTRAIYYFVTNSASKTSGNLALRNRIIGKYYPAIYLSGVPDAAAGIENNLFAFNVLETPQPLAHSPRAFNVYFNTNSPNLASGVNYFLNNTVNYPTPNNYGIGFELDTGAGNWTLQNNIIAHTDWSVADIGPFTGTPFTFDHNDYYYSPSNATNFFYSGTGETFTQWQGTTGGKPYGFDLTANGSFFGDPVLNLSNSALTTNSPAACLTGGTPIGTIMTAFGISAVGIDGKVFDPVHPSMGAYAQSLDTTPPPPATITGDLNGDSAVNATDFSIIKTDFLKLTAVLTNPKSDIDTDGQVTIKDVGILMNAWK